MKTLFDRLATVTPTRPASAAGTVVGVGLFALVLAGAGLAAPALADGPQMAQQSTQTKAKASSSARGSASRSSSATRSSSSSRAPARATSARRGSSPSDSTARSRRPASEWKGYDNYRRTTPRHYRPGHYYPSRPYRPYSYGGYYYWGPWGYSQWGYYPWGYGSVYPGTIRIYDERPNASFGALDLDLSPGDTQIFVDGGYVGTADDFDGWPTYLWLEDGTYDLVFFKEGYQTIYRQYTIRPGIVIDVGDRLQPGPSERPEDIMRPSSTEYRDQRLTREAERRAEARREEQRAAPERDDALGRLAFRVWPADAAIYLDGHFVGTAFELEQLSAGLLVGAGEHRIEITRPGHETWTWSSNVEAGEMLEIDVELEQR